MDPKLFASLTTMVDNFVSQKELEAKRRVEVYYNEEQAKVRNMHRRLKRQMSSFTEQIVKAMESEKQYQATIKQEEGSPALSNSSSPEFKNNHAPASPLHPHVIHVPDSPKMEINKNQEQITKDKFTAPLLAELDTQDDAIDSPPTGPYDEEGVKGNNGESPLNDNNKTKEGDVSEGTFESNSSLLCF